MTEDQPLVGQDSDTSMDGKEILEASAFIGWDPEQ